MIHLEIGDTRGFHNDSLMRHIQINCVNPALWYSPSAGEDELRETLSKLYSAEKGCSFDRKNVVISPANALISQALAVLCDAGDGVLIPNPGFPTYRLAANFNRLRTVYYHLDEADGWNPPVDRILNCLNTDRRIRAIIVNSPSNPVGVAFDKNRLEAISCAAMRLGVACIVEETYKNLVYFGEGQ